MASHAHPVPDHYSGSQSVGSGLDPRPPQFWRIVGEALIWAGAKALLWQRRISERRELMTLDHRLLRDIGLSRSDAIAEWRKPFWRA